MIRQHWGGRPNPSAMGDSAVDAAIESPITDYLPVFSPSHSMPRHLLVQLMQIDEDRRIPRLAREHLLQSPPKECEEAFDPGVMMTATQLDPGFYVSRKAHSVRGDCN